MSSTTAAQNNWVKSVLGFDIEALRGAQDEAKELPTEDEAKGGFFSFIAQKVGETVGTRPPLPTDKELAKALDDLDEQIEAVKALGFDTKRLEEDRWDCAWSGDKAEKLKDDARTKALTGVKSRIAQLISHAKSLADSATSVMGKSKDAPTADQKSKIYQKAIEDHYGIKISNPSNMPNTHLDRVFDMFGTVPVDDAKQDKLTDLEYTTTRGSGSYNRVDLVIKMGDFGDASITENYEIDGVVLPANSFDVTTLHEIGHAVDNKHSVMLNNRAKAGCGGWNPETADSITAAYLLELKKTPGLSEDADEGALSGAIKTALTAGTTAKPDEIKQADWTKVVDFLTKKCLPIRAASKPWFAGSQVVVNTRVYQEAYGNQWWSYDNGARATTKVNGYQWRAPGEWFAEIYAITWLKKKKPPGGVDASAAEYMWNG